MKLNLRSVDLNLLTVFDAIMETGQLSQAGEQLGMSQPAVSAALQRLRETLKDDLFIRNSHGMTPTPRARELYPSVSQALDSLRVSLESGRQFDPARCKRRMHLMGGDYVELLYLGPLLERIRTADSEMALEVSPLIARDYEHNLQMGDMDLAVHYVTPVNDGLESTALTTDRLVVVAAAGHPRLRKQLSLKQFLAEGHVTLRVEGRNIGHFEMLTEGNSQPRRVVARVTQFSGMVSVVAATDLLGLMPASIAEIFARNYPIRLFQLPLTAPALNIQMVWARRFTTDLAHKWLREQLLDIARQADQARS